MKLETPKTSAARFTPGPWIVSQENAGTIDVIASRDCIRSRIARLHCELLAGEHGGSIQANAQLISAAPDLIALVMRFRDICKRGGDIQRGPKGKEFDLEAQIEAALRKAGQ